MWVSFQRCPDLGDNHYYRLELAELKLPLALDGSILREVRETA